MVLGGIIGGGGGCWIGHVAAWSTDPDKPQRIGGGLGAVLLSVGLAIAGVLIVDGPLRLRARRQR